MDYKARASRFTAAVALVRKARKAIAAYTQEFLRMVKNSTHKLVFDTKSIDPNARKWLSVYANEVEGQGPFFYAERMGKDSVAFVLMRKTPNGGEEYCLLNQWCGPHNRFVLGAFTGSMDKPDKSPHDILIEEILEEAGYDLSSQDDFWRISTVPHSGFVCGWTNEVVHLFAVDVTGMEPVDQQPENIFEENTALEWCPPGWALNQSEWKARTIIEAFRSVAYQAEDWMIPQISIKVNLGVYDDSVVRMSNELDMSEWYVEEMGIDEFKDAVEIALGENPANFPIYTRATSGLPIRWERWKKPSYEDGMVLISRNDFYTCLVVEEREVRAFYEALSKNRAAFKDNPRAVDLSEETLLDNSDL